MKIICACMYFFCKDMCYTHSLCTFQLPSAGSVKQKLVPMSILKFALYNIEHRPGML